jgi:Domain of unknown function (DUF1983)
MSKVVLNDISNITGNPTSAEQTLNANFQAIEEAIEKTYTRDGTAPNFLDASMDANSHRIVNLPYALSETEPVTLGQAYKMLTGQDWLGVGIPAIVYYQENEPIATAVGELWIKPSDLSIWIWNGTGWIRQSDPQLQEALDRIAATEGSVLDMQPRLLQVEQDTANHTIAIFEIESDIGNMAGEIVTITADLGSNTAAIQSEAIARALGDEALAATINTLQASNAQIFIQDNPPVAGVGGVPNPIPDGSFWYDSNDGNKQYRWLNGVWNDVTDAQLTALAASITTEQLARIGGDEALASDITNLWAQRNADYAVIVTNNLARVDGDTALAQSIATLTSSLNGLTSTVTTNNEARIQGDSALASSISSVNTSVSGLSTTVSQHTTSINGIQGKYAVKIDANGYITGFGLVATNNNAAPTSKFTVLADNFEIVTPGSAAVRPFYVEGGVTYIRNVVIDSAAIGTATIGTLNLIGNSVTEVVSATLDHLGNTVNNTPLNIFTNLTTTAGTMQITVPNIPTSGSPKVFVKMYVNAKYSGSANDYIDFRIRRNDGVILPSSPSISLEALIQAHSWEFFDAAPVSTTHTYTVQIKRKTGATTEACGQWYDSQMIATLLKR